jgi:hypothetical protein
MGNGVNRLLMVECYGLFVGLDFGLLHRKNLAGESGRELK